MIDPTDPCQNPACTRENGRCIGYHCPYCGKPANSMGHSNCVPSSSPTSRVEKNLQDAVAALWRRINAALTLHSPYSDDDQHCKACGVDAHENEIPWPCDTVRALRGEEPTGEADRG